MKHQITETFVIPQGGWCSYGQIRTTDEDCKLFLFIKLDFVVNIRVRTN